MRASKLTMRTGMRRSTPLTICVSHADYLLRLPRFRDQAFQCFSFSFFLRPKDKLVAIQERFSYSQRTGNSLHVCSALFNILATPAEIEADSSSDPAPPRTLRHLSDHTLSGALADCFGFCYAYGEQGHLARDCRTKWKL